MTGMAALSLNTAHRVLVDWTHYPRQFRVLLPAAGPDAANRSTPFRHSRAPTTKKVTRGRSAVAAHLRTATLHHFER